MYWHHREIIHCIFMEIPRYLCLGPLPSAVLAEVMVSLGGVISVKCRILYGTIGVCGVLRNSQANLFLQSRSSAISYFLLRWV